MRAAILDAVNREPVCKISEVPFTAPLSFGSDLPQIEPNFVILWKCSTYRDFHAAQLHEKNLITYHEKFFSLWSSFTENEVFVDKSSNNPSPES